MTQGIVESLRIGPEKNFCYLILCPETFEGALVDPSFEFDRVLEWVRTFGKPGREPHIRFFIATHGHWDHAGGFPEMLKRLPQAKVVAHENEKKRLSKAGIPLHLALKDNEEFHVGNMTIRALHTPGHTEGGCCYLMGSQVITGDTLFVGQCGRTDLEGGSDEALFQSLQRLKTLPPETIVRPGHDYGRTPQSTIGNEMATNPTMKAKTVREFVSLP